MNLADMRKLFAMASSGEMQAFIGNFQAELDAIRHDREGLKKAFPHGYAHFNARFDQLESKVDSVLSLLMARGTQDASHDTTEQPDDVGSKINGTGYDATSVTSGSDAEPA